MPADKMVSISSEDYNKTNEMQSQGMSQRMDQMQSNPTSNGGSI